MENRTIVGDELNIKVRDWAKVSNCYVCYKGVLRLRASQR